MRIELYYFATIRDIAGVKHEQLDLPEASTVEELKIHIASRYPKMAEALNTCLVSVDRKIAQNDRVILEGEEVAIFPPISGG